MFGIEIKIRLDKFLTIGKSALISFALKKARFCPNLGVCQKAAANFPIENPYGNNPYQFLV